MRQLSTRRKIDSSLQEDGSNSTSDEENEANYVTKNHAAVSHRKTAAVNLKKQVDTKMLERERGLLPQLVVGDNAFLGMPQFDRGPTDPRTLVVVVLNIENESTAG